MTRSMLMVFIGIVTAVALAGGGFVAGLTVGSTSGSQAPIASPRAGGQAPRQGGGQAPGGGQGRAVNGQVLSVGEGTVTIQLGQDQGSRIVLVAPSTRLVKTTETEIKLADIKAGDRVQVLGQDNPDGTVNAQAIVVGGAPLQQLFGSPRPSPSR